MGERGIRHRYMPWINEMKKLCDFLAKTQANIAAEEENKRRDAKRIE
jgi:hypothetical protein